MKNSFALTFIWFTLTILVFSACNNNVDKKQYLSKIDDQMSQVDSAFSIFDVIKNDEIIAVLDTVKKDLTFFDKNLSDELSFERAKVFSDYRTVSKYVKGYTHKYKRISGEFQRTQLQLNGLKKAISDGATVDADGQKIDEAYIQKALSKETEVAHSLVVEVNTLNKNVNDALDAYSKIRPAIKKELAILEASISLNTTLHE